MKLVNFNCILCGIKWAGKAGSKYCGDCRDEMINRNHRLSSEIKRKKIRQKNNML